jgi:hypothetical protein
MVSTIEVFLTIIALSFWILFPIGIFLSVSKVDKNTDQVIRLDQYVIEETREEESSSSERPVYEPVPFDWHHPIIYFRRWLQHE